VLLSTEDEIILASVSFLLGACYVPQASLFVSSSLSVVSSFDDGFVYNPYSFNLNPLSPFPEGQIIYFLSLLSLCFLSQ
jgi:hypothetical protein